MTSVAAPAVFSPLPSPFEAAAVEPGYQGLLRTPGVLDHLEKGPLLDHDSGKANHHISCLPKDRDQGDDPGDMLGHQQLLDGPPQQRGQK